MKIPINFFLKWNAYSDKAIKFIGDNIGKILVGLGVCATGVGAKTIPKEIEKKRTKYEYKGWTVYKRGSYVYAIKNHDKIKLKNSSFDEIEKVINTL